MTALPAGWGFPLNARRAHYFAAGEAISLCRKWMYAGHREPETGARSKDDCAACLKKAGWAG